MEGTENSACDNSALYEKYYLKYYTPKEELWNCLTHLVGAVLAVVGGVYAAIVTDGVLKIAATVFLCFCCALVYGVSAAYHGVSEPKLKSFLRRIDHADVCFIICGCGAPVCLCLSDNIFNYVGFGLCLALAFTGATLCIINLRRFQRLALLFDFLVGGILTAVFLVNKSYVSFNTKIFYAAGLACCLTGAVLYRFKKKYVHTLFHVFMLVGTVIFYFGTLRLAA